MPTPESHDNQPTPNNDNGELDPNSLQAKLAEYQRAIQAEYELAEKAASAKDVYEGEKVTREYFRSHVPTAAAQIIHMMQFSSSDSTKLSAAKFVIAEAYKSEQESTDPVNDLIKQLTKQPLNTPTK